MFAMKFGDNCWLKNLERQGELNGRRVSLFQWNDEAQRWRCKPEGWALEGLEFLTVRPRNLAHEPPETPPTPPAPRPPDRGADNAVANKLLRLLARQSELQTAAQTAWSKDVQLRLSLCSVALLQLQAELFRRNEQLELLHRAEDSLTTEDAKLAQLQAAWASSGLPALNFWEDGVEPEPEDDPALRAWAENRKKK